MAPNNTTNTTPPSSTSSIHGPPSPESHNRVVRKRNRVPLSCGPCRHRKLKCNRSTPCDNCIKRGDMVSCSYASPGNRKKSGSNSSASASPDEMQNRIDRLESLVLSLVTNGSQAAGPAAAAELLSNARNALSETQDMEDDRQLRERNLQEDSDIELSRSVGVMNVKNDRQFFASEAHWWAILSDIAEVKTYFAEHRKQVDEQFKKVRASKSGDPSASTALLFKGISKVDRSEILSNFPSKVVADKLITRYFSSENPASHIIHFPTFRKEYEMHWTQPDRTSVVWMGMCFAMMCLALQSFHNAGDEPPEYRGKAREAALLYSEWTAQCLVLADYTQPLNYMIETLIFYLQCEMGRIKDAETGIWILSGIVTRLAMRQGMHRDSKPYTALSAFQGEMRRRKWGVIRSTDTMLSFQSGLPSMVKSCDYDTALPSNIWDEEFDENTKVLPPSRPCNEITQVSYMIANHSLSMVLGRILEQTQSLKMLPYDETMKLDAELRDTRARIPEHFQLLPRNESNIEASDTLMERYVLDLLYNKSQCILHRRYLSKMKESHRFAYSQRTCIDACVQMLDHQSTLHNECQPGGRLRAITWSPFTTLTMHDYLLAAMIVCLHLYRIAQAEADGHTTSEIYQWALERREDLLMVIERAVGIWEELRDQSIEAYKASTVLNVMLEKLKNHQSLRQQLKGNFSFEQSSDGPASDGHVAPEHSAAMTLGMMSTGGMHPDRIGMFDRAYLQPPRTGLTPQPPDHYIPLGHQIDGMSPFANTFGTSFGPFHGMDLQNANFDWDAWDTYVQGSHMDASGQIHYIDSALLDGMAPTQPHIQNEKHYPMPDRQPHNPWAGTSGVFMGGPSGDMHHVR